MGELYNPYPRLPKNIRQVGEREQIVKLYVEDYVNTYLKRLYPAGGQDLRVGLLLGDMKLEDGTPYIFIDGAMEMEGVSRDGERVELTETAWKAAYQVIEQMFPKRSVQGWFLCGAQGCNLSPLNYWKEHTRYFPEKYKLMYLNSGLEGEEALYITSDDGFYKLCGHNIYYERNQMMQDYMVMRKDVRRVESGTSDVVTRDFRQRMEDRKAEIRTKNSTVSMLGTACSVLTIAVLAGGIVMFRDYQRMREMESVITSVMPQAASAEQMEAGGADAREAVEVEEIPGLIYPTEADTFASARDASSGGGIGAAYSAADSAVVSNGSDDGAAGSTQTEPPAEIYIPVGEPESAGTSDTASASANASAAPGFTLSAEEEARLQQEITAATAEGRYLVYEVKEGETLYGICLEKYKSVNRIPEICLWNHLESQDRIAAGQKLFLPE